MFSLFIASPIMAAQDMKETDTRLILAQSDSAQSSDPVGIVGTAWLPVALVLACYEIAVVLILRALWTLDVITGIFAAFIIASNSPVIAGWCDPLLALLARG
jgi:hypothetical protein